MVPLAKELLKMLQLEATDEDFALLQNGDVTDFSKRVPEDPREPGILTMVTMHLHAKEQWELEFQFRQSKDPVAQSVRPSVLNVVPEP
jgi:hypothetical protein